MHIMDQRLLGALILLLLAALIVVKQKTTGSVVEKPPRNLLLWLVNGFNLLFLVVANPLAAILLLTGRMPGPDLASLTVTTGWLLKAVEVAGLLIYLLGFFLMAWALIRLGRNYQLGGIGPRPTDAMILAGPYAHIRHPMYTAALCIAFGLSCLIASWVCLGAFIVYLVLILRLIPVEEEHLLQAYGEPYGAYRKRVGKLLPSLKKGVR